MMNKMQLSHNQGFILVATLSFLAILSLFAFAAAETSLLASRQANSQWLYWQNRQSAIHAHQAQIKQLLQGKKLSCLQAFSLENYYWQQTAWPEVRTCSEHNVKASHDSVVEQISQPACNTRGQAMIMYRLTTVSLLTTGVNFHQQSTIAIPTTPKIACQAHAIRLSLGQQTWRMESKT